MSQFMHQQTCCHLDEQGRSDSCKTSTRSHANYACISNFENWRSPWTIKLDSSYDASRPTVACMVYTCNKILCGLTMNMHGFMYENVYSCKLFVRIWLMLKIMSIRLIHLHLTCQMEKFACSQVRKLTNSNFYMCKKAFSIELLHMLPYKILNICIC